MDLFLVFAGDNYYPSGGWEDYRSTHLTKEDADAAVSVLLKDFDWAYAVNLREELVPSGE